MEATKRRSCAGLLAVLLCAIVYFGLVNGSNDALCPEGWTHYGQSCYLMVGDRTATWPDAQNICASFSASLISVNTRDEHAFFSKWLEEKDIRRRSWWTSGRRTNNGGWEWTGDGSKVGFYAPGASLTGIDAHIAYGWRTDRYTWMATNSDIPGAFICEISQTKTYLYEPVPSDLNYGLTGSALFAINRGPQLVMEPEDVIINTNGPQQSVELSCQANAMPSPVYQWMKNTIQLIEPRNSKYAVVGGNLIIRNISVADIGAYHCIASSGAAVARSRKASVKASDVKRFPQTRLDVYGNEGEGKYIGCNAPVHFPQSMSFAWTYDAIRSFVQESNRVFISGDGTLYFSYLTKGDQRNYSCNVILPAFQSGYYGPFFALKIIEDTSTPSSVPAKPTIPEEFLRVYPPNPQFGQAAWIDCFAYGRPSPIYKWERINGEISSLAIIRSFGRRLFFPKLRLDDAGTYRCTAENANGVSIKEINLIFKIAPTLMSELKNVVADPGENAQFICDVYGVPQPDFEWFFNGAPLTKLLVAPEDQHRIDINREKLIIKNVKPHDSGVYQCFASSVAGEISTSAELIVRPMGPNFSNRLADRTVYVHAGNEVQLACDVETSRPTTISWWRDGNSLEMGRRMSLSREGKLTIAKTVSRDSGRYVCTSENQFGDASASLSLVVLNPLVLAIEPLPMEGAASGEIGYSCRVTGDIDSAIDIKKTITFNSHDIRTLNQFRVDRDAGKFYLSGSDTNSGGIVMCRVDTVAGHASVTTQIMRKGSPVTPIKLRAYDPTPTGVFLSWETPVRQIHSSSPSDVALAYRIEMQMLDAEDWTHMKTLELRDLPPNKKVFVPGKMLPYKQYRFRIVAQSRVGSSFPSHPSGYVKAPGGAPLAEVRQVTTTVFANSQILVQWQPLDVSDWGSNSISYNVEWQYKNISSSKVVRSSEKVTDSEANYHVIQLDDENMCIVYQVKVYASNEFGRGPVGESYTVDPHLFDAPTTEIFNVSTVSLNSTAILAQWNVRHQDDISLPCQRAIGIKVMYWISSNSSTASVAPFISYVAIDQPELILTKLIPDTEYDFQLMALNARGDGPKSAIVKGVTKRRAPQSSPLSVTVYDDLVDDEPVAVVQWTKIYARENDAPLLGYKIYLYDGPWSIPRVYHVDRKQIDNDQSAVHLEKLKPFNDYRLRLCAYNDGGDGPLTEAIYFSFGARSFALSVIQCQSLTVLAISMLISSFVERFRWR